MRFQQMDLPERRMLRALLLVVAVVIVVWMLSGCASGTTQTPVLVASQSAHPVVRQDLMQPCPDLPLATSGSVQDLLSNHVLVALAYVTCRVGKADLVNAVRGQVGIDVAQ